MTQIIKLKTINNKKMKVTITKKGKEVVSVELEPW